MVRMNDKHYIERGHANNKTNRPSNVFIVRADRHTTGFLELNSVHFPPDMVGKRIRIKVEEVIDDKKTLGGI